MNDIFEKPDKKADNIRQPVCGIKIPKQHTKIFSVTIFGVTE